ncbi:flagellar hook-length control protein FliK [Rivihabitans pingtungensis]|uniref:flagellar hook-length control protein FliK n=1 Tax=Rivihabitans pingtungensis TaxID=1054498 RepID=UPI002FD90D46
MPRVLDAAGKAQSASAARFPPGLSSLLGGEKANAGGQALALSPLFENMDALPTTGMAQLLKQAVTRSGVFYESHLADWAQSGRSLHALRQEPQANLKLPEKLAELGKPDGQNNASVQEAMKTGSATGLRDRELAGLRNDSNTTQLGQLVHKQLDVLDQNQFSWQGIAWPGQAMDWRIEREQVDQREAHGGGEEESRWSTSLSMELPNLGGLAAKIALTPAGVIVRFQTDSADTAQAIEDNQLRLRENLQRAGLSLLNFAVSQGEQPNAG